jgi:glycosyltransferase involved in cell wall biosynthesis
VIHVSQRATLPPAIPQRPDIAAPSPKHASSNIHTSPVTAPPSVSVVIATYNRSALLRQAVRSMLEQTISDIELVIVDDASTDDTPATLKELEALDSRIRSIRLASNAGPGEARNRGIAVARSDLIAILDDDDIALPDRLAIERTVLQHSPELALVFSPVRWIDHLGRMTTVFPELVHQGNFPQDTDAIFRLLYLDRNYVENTTVMLRRTNLGQLRYATFTRIGEDRMLFLQLAALKCPIRALCEPLVLQRRGPVHKSLMGDKKAVLEAQRQVLSATRTWLSQQGIARFDHLHRRAMANQLTRDARYRGGVDGLVCCLRGFALDPLNGLVIKNLVEFAWRAAGRGIRILKRVIARQPVRGGT